MDNSALQQHLSQLFPQATVSTGHEYIEVTVEPSALHATAATLKSNEECRFDYLFCQTGVDIKGKLGVVCHLRSTQLGHSCVLKSYTDNRENAVMDTLSDIWTAAQFFEREIYDLLGIHFANHPNLKRIFLEDDFVGHPLRKDFEDNINIIQR
jgi:NADH:ubiquinone oxidoreductase subunit C